MESFLTEKLVDQIDQRPIDILEDYTMPDSFKFRAMTYNLHLFGDSVVGFETFNDYQRLTGIIRAIRD